MGKRKKGSGWVNRLFQRVTLTEQGKKQAPMRRGKAKKKTVKNAAMAAFLLRESIDGFDDFDHDFGDAFFDHIEFFCGT
jgi:hypothetical protein